MTVCFRRVCTKCLRTVDWKENDTEDGEFFHLDDKSPLCTDGHVDLEVKEQ